MRFAVSSVTPLLLSAAVLMHGQTTYPNTPIQHVIVVVQENRTPDNLFGADAALITRGAHLVSSGNCQGVNVNLSASQLGACFDPSHEHEAWVSTYDSGSMDGACTISAGVKSTCASPMCTVNGKQKPCPEYTFVSNTKFDGVHGILDPYFQLARQNGFANYMFQTNQGPSFPAHQFLFSGTSQPTAFNDPGDNGNLWWEWFAADNSNAGGYGCTANQNAVVKEVSPNNVLQPGHTPNQPAGAGPGFPCYNHGTLSDVLDNAGVTWRYYGNGAGSLWMAPNAIEHICQTTGFGGVCNGPAWTTKGEVAQTPGQILTDLGADPNNPKCDLQAVSWVIPDGNWSDHPGNKKNGTTGHDGGPSWVAAIVNALGGVDNSNTALPTQCNYWNNTAVVVTWDDWGGFYDDVDPIKTIGGGNPGYPGGGGEGQYYVYGFRVPLLVISAYNVNGTKGYISGPSSNPTCPNFYCHDFGSILNFIEFVFGPANGRLPYIARQWPHADFFAQDTSSPPNNYSLYDFFNFHNNATPFIFVNGAKYSTSCFLNPASCFGADFPADPDNDIIDGD
jgi:phospholipase C